MNFKRIQIKIRDKLNKSKARQLYAVAAFVTVGVLLALIIRASPFTVSFETEDATLAGNASTHSTTDASSGSFLKFNAPTSFDNLSTHAIKGTYIESPSDVGPFSDSNGSLYFVNELAETSPTFTMRKSTDGGKNWTIVDSANRPKSSDLESMNVIQEGSVLYIFLNEGGFANLHTFNMSDHPSAPDRWAIKDEAVSPSHSLSRSQQTAALVRRSDGSFVAFYNRSASSYDKIYYKIRSANGNWGAEQPLEIEDSIHWHAVVAETDNQNNTHIMYYGGNGSIWYRKLSAANSLSSRTQMETNVGTSARNRSPLIPAVKWSSGSDEKIMFFYNIAASSGSQWRLRSRVITNGGAPAAAKIVNANQQTAQDPGSFGSRMPVATAAAYGSKVMIIFGARDGTSTSAVNHLWYTESINDGGWSPEKILLDRSKFHHNGAISPDTGVEFPDQVFMLRGRIINYGGKSYFGFIADQEPTGGTDGSFYSAISLP